MEPAILIFSLIVLLLSVVVHELAHGYVALSLGDLTAKYAGRLTLNPLKHLDLFGSLILPLLLLIATAGQGPVFGWAKPIPINPHNFKDQKWGSLKVALAGPATNFAVAIAFGLFIRMFGLSPQLPFTNLMGIIVFYNFLLCIFNLIPIPPLDGHWILFSFLPRGFDGIKFFLQQYGIFILIFLIFFGGLQGVFTLSQYLFSITTGLY
ncbi:MAG: site-2 protease family protein [Patescibacteria group bacterium]